MTRPSSRRPSSPSRLAVRVPEKGLTGSTLDVTVEALGAGGDGIARAEGRTLYIPLAAPGELVRVLVGAVKGDGFAARLLGVSSPGPARVVPPCPHFGDCGGCGLQHIAPDIVAEWKRQRVIDALRQRGFGDATVLPTLTVPPETGRRRAAFAAFRGEKGLAVGFHARGSRRVVEVGCCLLLTATLGALKGRLAELLDDLLAPGESCQAVATDLGGVLDVVLALPHAPDRRARERAAAFAAEIGLARLSWRLAKDVLAEPDPLAALRPCRIAFSGMEVEFPPGAFLQPSAAGEEILRRLVLEAAGGAGPALDLFSGLGPFAFALAARNLAGKAARVRAVEGTPALAKAAGRAAARAGLAGRMAFEARDLERRPLAPAEMGGFGVCVFDPPRAGAKAQAAMLARAPKSLACIVAVSCNPASFARDARILAEGGWKFAHATPVDQFAYSPHVELVALFLRAGTG